MFCNTCGAPIQPDYRVCPKCGRAVQGAGMPAAPFPQGRVARHIKPLAILWMVVGAFWLIPAFGILIAGSMAGVFLPMNHEIGRTFGPFVLHTIGSIFLLIAAGGFAVGWGLMQRRSWARITAIVLGFIALLHPPLATALGIYTLWVLLPGDAEREYNQMTGMA
jgi:zinc ribbon protein